MASPPKRRRRPDPKRAVALLRVSTTRERQDLGHDAQRAAIEAWAEKSGVAVVGWFLDECSGAADLDKRVGLLDAIRALEAKRAGVLVTASVDRLARSPAVQVLVEHEVGKLGARLAFADGNGDGDDPTAELLRGMLSLFARFERAVLRGRLKRAYAEKRKRGEFVGKAPFGFRLGPDGVHLEPDPAEQKTIAAATKLREKGVAYRALGAELAKRGHLSRAGTPLTVPTIHDFLHRDAKPKKGRGS